MASKVVTMSAAAAFTFVPKHPDRTARKTGTGMDFDVTFRTWPNRAAMARAIRKEESGEGFANAWRACTPLTTTEGY